MKKAELVFIPSPGITHLLPTIEFVKLLLERDERFSVTVLVMKPEMEFTEHSFHSHIRFIDLPHVEPPPLEVCHNCAEKYESDAIESHRECVKDAIVKQVLPNSPQVAGLVLDFFCSSMVDVANELGIPSYIYFTSGAAFLGFMLYLPGRHDQVGKEFEESDPESIVPGYKNPVPANVLPTFAYNKEGGYICFVDHARRFKETKGILVNTFLDLESYVISSFPADYPPVYAVGPFINHNSQNQFQPNQAESKKIMKWLDDQPPSSVVFLCFGSKGRFGAPQLKEIALALEQTEHRFLWCLRFAEQKEKLPVDLNSILPEGFLERTKGKGFICGWAPQVDVLANKAIGGFVSHCGWNSILESLWYGVPIVTWPLYAEQQPNAFQMVKELGLAVELRMDFRSHSGIVIKADELAKAVKCVMEADSEIRKKVKDMSMKSRNALVSGGSSFESIGNWIETLLEEF